MRSENEVGLHQDLSRGCEQGGSSHSEVKPCLYMLVWMMR